MCGLFGFTGAAPDPAALHATAVLAGTRGPHAWGLTWYGPGETRLRRLHGVGPLERGLTAEVLTGLPGPVIGHARLSTSGPPTDPANNQPLEHAGVTIAHNGNVYNWRALRDRYGLMLRTACDSEVIAHLIAGARTWTGHPDWSWLQCVGWAVAKVDVRSPLALLVLVEGHVYGSRRGHPLYARRAPDGVYLCSRPGPGAVPLPADITVEVQ